MTSVEGGRRRPIKLSQHARHSGLNLLGSIIPLLIGLPSIGLLARFLDPTAFALMMLTLAIVGYAGVLDLGLSRAVVALVAEAGDDRVARRRAVSAALGAVAVIGPVVALLIVVLAPLIASGLMRVPPAHLPDATAGLRLTAWSIPMLLLTLVIQGYLEGIQDFVESNLQRILSGGLPILLAASAAPIWPTLTGAMGGFLAGRTLVLLIVVWRRDFWRIPSPGLIDKTTLRHLASFGGWLTVSSLIAPLMGYLDRFILAYARGPGPVGYYAAPAEAVYRLLVVPTAITRSLFPKLSARPPANEAAVVLRETRVMILLSCLPVSLAIILFAPVILELWLGPRFRVESTDALRLLAIGFIPAALANIPFTRLLAAGRPDVIAILHLGQLLPFLVIAYYLAVAFGATGAAAAWTIRNFVDVLLLGMLASRYAKT